MKKLTFILAAILLAFGLSACSLYAPAGGTQTPPDTGTEDTEGEENMQLFITVGETRLETELEENVATAALIERLQTAPITINMSDYGGWEKVGGFGFGLPTSNRQITTQPCDFVLYSGNQLVIFYGSNEWSYTPLGRITGVTPTQLKAVLGDGDVTVTLSLSD